MTPVECTFEAAGPNRPRSSPAKLIKRHELAQFIIEYLYRKYSDIKDDGCNKGQEEIPVEFSVMELGRFGSEIRLFSTEASLAEVEDALFYLSRIGPWILRGREIQRDDDRAPGN